MVVAEKKKILMSSKPTVDVVNRFFFVMLNPHIHCGGKALYKICIPLECDVREQLHS